MTNIRTIPSQQGGDARDVTHEPRHGRSWGAARQRRRWDRWGRAPRRVGAFSEGARPGPRLAHGRPAPAWPAWAAVPRAPRGEAAAAARQARVRSRGLWLVPPAAPRRRRPAVFVSPPEAGPDGRPRRGGRGGLAPPATAWTSRRGAVETAPALDGPAAWGDGATTAPTFSPAGSAASEGQFLGVEAWCGDRAPLVEARARQHAALTWPGPGARPALDARYTPFRLAPNRPAFPRSLAPLLARPLTGDFRLQAPRPIPAAPQNTPPVRRFLVTPARTT